MSTHVTIKPSILYFGTPVALLSTLNDDGSANLAPMSSAWALGDVFVLGLGSTSHTAANLRERPELVINLPAPGQWRNVERLAPLTGANPVPAQKQAQFRHEKAKFEAAGLTAVPSDCVQPPRAAECPVQIEASAVRVGPDAGEDFTIVEAKVLCVHADRAIVADGTSHIDTDAWSPLIYNFRHYFGLGERLGKTFRAEY